MANPQTDTNIDHKANIREVQNHLREISYIDKRIPMIPVDGFYSPQTEASVAAFQKYYGLPVTGEVNKETWDKVYEEYLKVDERKNLPQCVYAFPSSTTVLMPGDVGDAVYFLQIMLSALGTKYNNIPKVDINGVYDLKTQQAVSFMQKATLTFSEGVDKATWNAITRTYNTLI